VLLTIFLFFSLFQAARKRVIGFELALFFRRLKAWNSS